MSDLKRYTNYPICNGNCTGATSEILEDNEGEWVKYTDLESQVRDMKKKIKERDWTDGFNAQQDYLAIIDKYLTQKI